MPLLLCYLDGLSRDEAAQRLGCSAGAVKGNLERGRSRLRNRLARRGVTLSAGLLAAIAAPARAIVPAGLVESVVASATGAPGSAWHAGLLAHGILRAMSMKQVKPVVAGLLLAGALGLGVGLQAQRAGVDKPEPPAAPTQPAVAAAKAERLILKGRVQGPDGRPIAGAKLFFPTFRNERAIGNGADGEPTLQATTGPDGRFEFGTEPIAPDRWFLRQLVAVVPGYAADWANPTQPGPDGELTFRLVPDDVAIRGRIVDLEGRPVAGATVRTVRVETTPEEDLTPVIRTWPSDPYTAVGRASKQLYAPGAGGLSRQVRTDRDGRFEVRGAGRDRMVALRVEGETIEHRMIRVVTTPKFDPKTASPADWSGVMPGRGRRPRPPIYGPEFTHSARPSQAIVGTVRDKDTGKPTAGVHVLAQIDLDAGWFEDAVTTQTDAEGRYRAIGLPKTPLRQVRIFAGEQSPYLPAAYSVRDVEGLGPITFDLEMVRGVLIRGRVVEKNTDKPVRGAGIGYRPLADNSHFDKTPGDIRYRVGITCSSGDDGRFLLAVPPGPGVILAQAETRGGVATMYTQVRLDPADRPRAYLEQVEQLGEAFAGAGGEIVTLGGASAYKVVDPPAGALELPVDLTFDIGRSLSGTVLDPDGRPLAGCTVGGLTATYDQSQTLKDATFTAIALDPERPRTVVFLHRDRKLGGAVKLSGAEPTPPAVKLEPCGTITGRVLDAEGRPIAGATASLSYRDPIVHRSASSGVYGRDDLLADEQGRFRIDGLIPGQRFSVGFRAKGRLLDAGGKYRDMTITPGELKDIGDIKSKPYGE